MPFLLLFSTCSMPLKLCTVMYLHSLQRYSVQSTFSVPIDYRLKWVATVPLEERARITLWVAWDVWESCSKLLQISAKITQNTAKKIISQHLLSYDSTLALPQGFLGVGCWPIIFWAYLLLYTMFSCKIWAYIAMVFHID